MSGKVAHLLLVQNSFCLQPLDGTQIYFALYNSRLFILCRYFPERHLGTTIALELDGMIEELGLEIDAIDKWSTNDNAANMVKSIRESLYLKGYFCDIHTLQLAIDDAFKDVEGMAAELPGVYPYTRGPNPTMYAGKPWTIR